VVQALLLEAAEETFDERIAVGRLWRRSDRGAATELKLMAESGAETGIPIHDHETAACQKSILSRVVARLLDQPRPLWVLGHAQKRHSTGIVVDSEEAVLRG
jgi:hypothetical protein